MPAFGQRNTVIANFVFGFPIFLFIPVCVLAWLFETTHSKGGTIGIFVASVGLCCLVWAKAEVFAKQKWYTFGPAGLSKLGRRRYYLAYLLIVAGILICTIAIVSQISHTPQGKHYPLIADPVTDQTVKE